MRIVYIDIDSLRPDHLGCYGYHRNTSPHIDALAREGVVFRRYYTPDAPCLPSRTAMYSGRFGIQTGVVGHGGTASQPKVEGIRRDFQDTFHLQGLGGQLQKLGFHTAMISPFGQRHAAWHFYAGFNEIHNTGRNGMESAEMVQPVVDRWLEQHATEDSWYLHINYWDPHTPYRVPENYGHPFAEDPLPAWLDDDELIARHAQKAGPHSAQDIFMYDDVEDPAYPRQPGRITDRASMRRIIDGYDTAIRYADDHVGRVIAALKQAGVYENTMIIISSDHGENFGELGIYAEHGTADEGTCHIPFIVRYPGGQADRTDDDFHYNVDLAPTLMELLGGEAQPLWDGQSFAPVILSGESMGREELVLSQCAHVCQRSVRWSEWLYIRTYHDGFHLFPDEMLFNIATDPHEQHNSADQYPELCQEGAWRLQRWHDRQMKKLVVIANDATDPLWTVMREGGPFHGGFYNAPVRPGANRDTILRYADRLEKTNRAEGALALRERYFRE